MKTINQRIERLVGRYTEGTRSHFVTIPRKKNQFYVCPLAHQIVGGPEDGSTFLPKASLDLLLFEELFDRITSQTLKINGDNGCLVVKGDVDQEFCTIHFYFNPTNRVFMKHYCFGPQKGKIAIDPVCTYTEEV